MMRWWGAALTGGLLAIAPAPAGELSKGEMEGQALARQMREQRPEKNAATTGKLILFEGRRKRAEIPFRCEIKIADAHWQTLYMTRPGTNAGPSETIIVTRNGSQPNRYESVETGCAAANVINPAQPFAGSDFWVMDLGLEFLHWPVQRVLKKELRRSQSCAVLESVNPATNAPGYMRVVSWVDLDTSGIVFAEAYDANRKLVKEFVPKNLEKVNGQYELQEMEMRSVRAGTRTRIEFDLKPR